MTNKLVSDNIKHCLELKQAEIGRSNSSSDQASSGEQIEIVQVNLDKRIKKAKDSKKLISHFDAIQDAACSFYKEKQKYEVSLKNQKEFFNLVLFYLFYEEIFTQLDDVYRYDLQRYPLDIVDRSFFASRKPQFAAKFKKLKKKTMNDLFEIIKERRKLNQLKHLNFTKYNSIKLEQIKQILDCFEKEKLFKILRHLVENYADYKDCNTDLILFDSFGTTKRMKFVVIRSGVDETMNENRQQWLKYLNSIGLEVEICEVES